MNNRELDRYLDRGIHFAAETRMSFPSVWRSAGEAMEVVNEVIQLAKRSNSHPNEHLEVLLGLWVRISRCQISSLLQIFARNLDEGLANLRMAAELTMVVKAVAKDPPLYEHWLSSEEGFSDSFRQAAQLDASKSHDKALIDTYNFCVANDHMSSAICPVDTIIAKEPNLEAVAHRIQLWFTQAIPMHMLCLKSVIDKTVDDDAYDLFSKCDLKLAAVNANMLRCILNDSFFKRVESGSKSAIARN